jgi:hypothetical protein
MSLTVGALQMGLKRLQIGHCDECYSWNLCKYQSAL